MEDIKTILKEYNEDIKRHINALKEDVDSNVRLLVEQYASIEKKLDSHSEMIVAIKEDVEIMKINTEFIKGSLKKKVDLEEFETLERRVAVLETKIRQS